MDEGALDARKYLLWPKRPGQYRTIWHGEEDIEELPSVLDLHRCYDPPL